MDSKLKLSQVLLLSDFKCYKLKDQQYLESKYLIMVSKLDLIVL